MTTEKWLLRAAQLARSKNPKVSQMEIKVSRMIQIWLFPMRDSLPWTLWSERLNRSSHTFTTRATNRALCSPLSFGLFTETRQQLYSLSKPLSSRLFGLFVAFRNLPDTSWPLHSWGKATRDGPLPAASPPTNHNQMCNPCTRRNVHGQKKNIQDTNQRFLLLRRDIFDVQLRQNPPFELLDKITEPGFHFLTEINSSSVKINKQRSQDSVYA